MIGIFFGGIFGGALTDYIGRKNTMIVCLVMIGTSLIVPVLGIFFSNFGGKLPKK